MLYNIINDFLLLHKQINVFIAIFVDQAQQLSQ